MLGRHGDGADHPAKIPDFYTVVITLEVLAIKKDDFTVTDMKNIVSIALDASTGIYTLTQTSGGTNVINGANYYLQLVWLP